MKLYYVPFACSLAAHITTREVGLDVTLVRVDLSTKRLDSGGDLFALNPMGQVPTLELDDGTVLTENLAVLRYLADQAPGRRLWPEDAGPGRYEFLRWLGFVNTELHKKVLHMIFAPDSPEAVRDHARACADRPLTVLARHLEQRDTLTGTEFTVADAYLVWALTLLPHAKIALQPYPALGRYHERHSTRPAVSAAVAFEREQLRRSAKPA